jgi:hypothetical protein
MPISIFIYCLKYLKLNLYSQNNMILYSYIIHIKYKCLIYYKYLIFKPKPKKFLEILLLLDSINDFISMFAHI